MNSKSLNLLSVAVIWSNEALALLMSSLIIAMFSVSVLMTSHMGAEPFLLFYLRFLKTQATKNQFVSSEAMFLDA